ncbi:MerR family transcriptional regulator [Armatimonas rosea]|uniref:DNA-binding transcriptional MerR regulator n=1 Tax=Armatimonas rosea TaxID=685828 RepID=A0A7W9SVZ7_ARMRO|nr:MerR family transcriptional regulator [Armatimonas rosea]MBB6053408.1 DNA-binding transcriptional MerR regulator [Armatimonas rosea]
MTMREIARECDIPESTLRVWRDEFEAFLPAVGEGKRRRYSEASQELLRQLVAWKKVGMPAEQIRGELARRNTPQARVRRRTGESQLDEVLALLRAQASELAALRAEVGELRRVLGQHAKPPRFMG